MFLSLPLKAQQNLPQVAVTQIVQHPALDETRRGIEDALKEANFKDKVNMLWRYENAQGNIGLATQIAQKFVGEHVKVMVTISTASTQTALSAVRNTNIPIVFASVTDPVDAKIVTNLKKPGGSITGVSNFTPIAPQFELFKRIVPQLKCIGVVFNPGEANSVALNRIMEKEGKKLGIQVLTAPAAKLSDVKNAAATLASKVDAFVVTNDNMVLAAFAVIVQLGINEEIPVFVSDTAMVAKGAVAALGPNQYEVGKQAGHMVVRVLRGERAGNIPVEFPQKNELYINLKAAQQMGVSIPQGIVAKAQGVIKE